MFRATLPRLQTVGLRAWTVRPKYKTYQSPFAPEVKVPLNFHGVTLKQMAK
ncbi:MAG: 54S ribosomal protein L4 mitochondrial [Watsoniomyces obsoletus]|nr:MAG: 54S ribosomal protein L4 mitochondrial [Watsoniomyces obsoletus]